jgi:hypothetical protein
MTKQAAVESVEKCSRIFVSWSWLVMIIAGLIIITVTAAIGYSERETRQDEAIKKCNYESIKSDLDTIKFELRKPSKERISNHGKSEN